MKKELLIQKNPLKAITDILEHLKGENFTDSSIYVALQGVLEQYNMEVVSFIKMVSIVPLIGFNVKLVKELMAIVPPVFYMGDSQDHPYILGDQRETYEDAIGIPFNDVDTLYQVYDMGYEMETGNPKTFWISELSLFKPASAAQHLAVAEYFLSKP